MANRIKTDAVETLITWLSIGVQKKSELKDLIDGVNKRLTFAAQIQASDPFDTIINIGPVEITLFDGRKMRPSPIQSLLPDFAGATIDLSDNSTTGNFVAFSFPDHAGTAGRYVRMGLSLDANGDINVTFNTPGATLGGTGDIGFVDGALPIGYIDLESEPGVGTDRWKTAGASATSGVENSAITQFMGAGGGGGGGAGGVRIVSSEVIEPPTTTITFPTSFNAEQLDGLFIFLNGNKMRRVTGVPANANEYRVIDNGVVSTQIEINAIAPANSLYEKVYFTNTFQDIGLAEKEVIVARGDAGGTNLNNMTVAQQATHTRVTLTNMTYILNAFPGGAKGDLDVVMVNGQQIEREIVGVNDTVGNIIYREVAGNQIDVFEKTAGGSIQLNNDVPIYVEKRFYFVVEIDAINTNIAPGVDATHKMGDQLLRWLEGHFVDIYGDTLNFPDGAQLRRNATTGQLEYRKDLTSSFLPLGGGGAGADLLKTLTEAELGDLLSVDPRSLLDAMNNNIGTLTNMEKVASALRLSAGQTLGEYTLEKELSADMNSVEGVAVKTAQAAVPKSITGNNVVFHGNVTAEFPAGSKVLFAKKLEQNNQTTHSFLMGADNNVARIEVGSSTYNVGNNETTVAFLNPGALDLTLGLIASEYSENHRVILHDDDFEVSGTGTGGFEAADLDDAYGLDNVRLEGSNFSKVIEELDGSILRLDGNMSDNGQYGVIRLLLKVPGNAILHFYYTVDSGNTWAKFAFTASANVAWGEEADNSWQLYSPSQVQVANNGKCFIAYPYNVAPFRIDGVYGDLTSVTPTLSPTASTGQGAGVIAASGGSAIWCPSVAADRQDLSLIVVLGTVTGDTSGQIHQFTNGGATYLALATIGPSGVTNDTVQGLAITGSSGSHDIHVAYRNTVGVIYYEKFSEGFNAGLGSNQVVISPNGTISGFHVNDTYAVILQNDSGTLQPRFSWRNHVNGSTSGNYVLYGHGLSTLIGTDTDSNRSNHRTWDRCVVTDPSDDKRLFITFETRQFNGGGNALEYTADMTLEIPDITELQGLGGEIDTRNAAGFLTAAMSGVGTSNEYRGDCFSVSGVSRKIRTIMVRATKISTRELIVGNDPTIQCFLYAATGSGAGAIPTGPVLATSQKVNLTKFGSGGDNNIYFNFNYDAAPGNYAFVIKCNYDGGAGYLLFRGGSAANEGFISADGSSWTTTGESLYFYVWDMYVNRLSSANSGEASSAHGTSAMEPQLKLLDSNQLRFSTRQNANGNLSSRISEAGVPFERTITISTNSDQSLKTELNCAVYNENGDIPDFDRNLVFSAPLGAEIAAKKNVDTGALEGARVGDLSHEGNQVTAVSLSAQTIDPDFQYGLAYFFDSGIGNYVQYSDTFFQSIWRQKFIIEAEVKASNIAGDTRGIVSSYSGANGWQFAFLTGGTLRFLTENGGVFAASVSNETFNLNQYYRVRAVGDGDTIRLFYSTGAALTAGPNGSAVFTECTYSSQVTGGYIAPNSGNPFYIGSINLSNYFSGYIGYVKFALGATEFAYDGHKDQRPVTHHILGTNVVFGKSQYLGNSNAPYNDAVVSKDGAPFVDSYDLTLWYKKALSSPGKDAAVKLIKRRGSDKIQSSYQGINFKFSK